LLGFDLETTGVDTGHDLPVQVGLVWTDASGVISSDAWIVDPGREVPEEAEAIHGISTERVRAEGAGLGETAHRIHFAVRRAAAGGIPVVAMNASFDVTIAEGLFASFGLPPLAWHSLIDPLVLDRHLDELRNGNRRLDALCEHYRVRLWRPHDAASDAEAAVGLARTIGRRFAECGGLDPEVLTTREARWHEEWAWTYDAWRVSEGLSGLDPGEFGWPYRREVQPQEAPVPPELELARRRHPTFSGRCVSARVA
jgi:DNA polymerase III subunit epsilon